MPGLTDEQLLQAIQTYQGANAPVAPPPVDPTVAMAAPAPAPVVVPPVQEAVQPPPVVDAALPPSAPDTYVVPQANNSREAMGQMDQASAAQANAITDETEAKRNLESQQAALLDTQNAEQQALAAKFQAEQAAGKERAQKIYDDSQKIESEANSIQTRDRRTTSQRVLGIIGTALGGLADGLSGFSGKQTNFAQQIEKGINDAVDKDMAQQQAAIAGKHKQAAMKLTEFGIAHKLFVDDPKAAFEYASLLRKDMFAKQAEALTKRSSNPVAAAQGAQAAQKILQENAEKKASLLASKENAIYAAQAANARVQTTADAAYRPGAQSRLLLEAKVADKTITPDEMQELNQILLQEKQISAEKAAAGKLSEGQAKAQQLYEASKADASRVEDAMKAGRLPDATDVRLHKSGVVPDSMIADTARVYRSAEAIVNDDLRDESGAQIGDNEKKALLEPLSSTDAEIRQQGYQRIIDKRNALYAKFVNAKKNPHGIQAGGKAVKATIAPDGAPATVQFNLGGKVGSIPADQAEAFQKKYPSAKRL